MNIKLAAQAALLAVAAMGGSAAPAMAEPAVVKQVAPEYPRGAERRNIEGSVSMAFDVSEAGRVENVTVVSESVPGVFDKAAVKALSQWKFEPNNPDSDVEVTISFKLS